MYLGLSRFNARQKAENFNYDNFKDVVTYCHLRNVKVYVAINTIIKESEIDDCISDVNFVISNNADAIIIQDVFMANLIHLQAPNFPLHLSTQSGICSLEGAMFAKNMGISRIVLARETPLKEIKRIFQNVDIEIEYFVQGALCVSYSGNCYFSSIIDGNSGNRGRCMQPCRKKMQLNCNGEVVDGYNLSPNDLCFYELFDDLVECGVSSFKIEGRLRGAEYVYYATSLYSDVVKGKKLDKNTFENLMISFNRGDYSKGYLNGRKSQIIYNKVQGNIGLTVGKVTSSDGKKVFVKSNYVPQINDGFKITRNDLEVSGGAYRSDCVQKSDGFELFAKFCKVNDEVRLTYSSKNAKFVDSLSDSIEISIEYFVKHNETIKLMIKLDKFSCIYNSEIVPQKAITSALTKTELETQLTKLNETQFVCNDIRGSLDEDIFLAKSQINAIRRNAVELFMVEYIKNDLKNNCDNVIYNKYCHTKEDKNQNKKKCVIVNEKNFDNELFKSFDIVVFKPFEYNFDNCKAFIEKKFKEKYLYIPNFISTNDIILLDELINTFNFDGIYSDGFNGVEIAKRHNLKIFLGINCNISNSLFEMCKEYQFSGIAYSKELNQNELKSLSDDGYILTFGGFSVMNFAHCPLINANICNCNSCKFKNVFYVDESNRKFKVAKTKIDGCFFTMLNNASIDVKDNILKNEIFDLSFYDNEETEEILVDSSAFKTKGHYSRGVK